MIMTNYLIDKIDLEVKTWAEKLLNDKTHIQ